MDFWLMIIGVIWLIGTWIRVYKQARFYQIEEYKSGRYLRWWLSKPDRYAPRRPLIAVFIGSVLAFFLSESPESPLPHIIAIITGIIAIIPPNEGEIKKAFNPTARAKRLLGASFSVAVFDLMLYSWLLSRLNLDDPALQAIGLSATGLLTFLTAPLILAAGNFLMYPVEATFRQGFIRSAKRVMAEINPTVIGITGSYGKTTTKGFVADILNGRYKAYPTPKSYNTMMGVCIAINKDLKHDYSIDYFVVEMGAYIRGEIQRICDLTPPHISIVVEVGPQHLERFGSLENIAIAKYEIIKNLPPDGVGVFNWDNPYVREMYERGYPQTRLAVSRQLDPTNLPENPPRFIATDIQENLDGLRFSVHDIQTGESQPFFAPVLGVHNVTNILLATAVAIHEGMSLQEIALRAKTLKPAESRLVKQVVPGGITIINDAYSANPEGVISSLKVLGMHTSGRRLVITPGMVELGDLHYEENYKLGQIIPQYATDVILVGAEQTKPIYDGIRSTNFPQARLQVVDELREAMAWYQAHFKAGDTVLFMNDLPDTY
ncbi:MAG: UDP-N-acetylmuramoyl-tripeptide--D-alanyl-D-alanine ligase [Chloroflexi bacterium]|nr:MAG: UDP-N-acetylmuramoyl-tripeptide--D-alanyl-D-alanine ligase [Chloroflexota bacterium]